MRLHHGGQQRVSLALPTVVPYPVAQTFHLQKSPWQARVSQRSRPEMTSTTPTRQKRKNRAAESEGGSKGMVCTYQQKSPKCSPMSRCTTLPHHPLMASQVVLRFPQSKRLPHHQTGPEQSTLRMTNTIESQSMLSSLTPVPRGSLNYQALPPYSRLLCCSNRQGWMKEGGSIRPKAPAASPQVRGV